MLRDFSDSAKQKLLQYVEDATATTTWGKIKDDLVDCGQEQTLKSITVMTMT